MSEFLEEPIDEEFAEPDPVRFELIAVKSKATDGLLIVGNEVALEEASMTSYFLDDCFPSIELEENGLYFIEGDLISSDPEETPEVRNLKKRYVTIADLKKYFPELV